MSKRPVVKNIDVATNYKRKPRRKTGDTSYPITYSNQIADFDIWHHMFLFSYCRNLTMHQFTNPPSVVLDLGCGTGYWAIEAAKRWPGSKVYGFDVAHIQPRLEQIGGFCSLRERVEWVHGNFLDGLPFPADFFDFVRIAGLGLAIPEDEWQSVLEDVRRVLKPGAPLEIVEEDLLFPCSSALLQKSRELCSPISAVSCPPYPLLHKSKSTVFYERSNTISERHLPSYKSKPDFQDHQSKPSFPPPFSANSLSPPSPISSPVSSDSTSETEHPQDHSRLKIAWEAMLATRFLSPNLLSVLPFYLTSSSFSTVSTLSQLSVPLPPNSGKVPNVKASHSAGKYRDQRTSPTLADTLFDFSAGTTFNSNTSENFSFQQQVVSLQPPQAPAWGTMHLAKTLNTIQGCKEAIYAEYCKLYFRDALHILSKTAPADVDDYSFQPQKFIIRRAFEVDWKNWELDMIDRIGMHKNLRLHTAWTQSFADSSHDLPEWRTWRNRLERNSVADMNDEHFVIGYNPTDLCCSMRIFTGFKS